MLVIMCVMRMGEAFGALHCFGSPLERADSLRSTGMRHPMLRYAQNFTLILIALTRNPSILTGNLRLATFGATFGNVVAINFSLLSTFRLCRVPSVLGP